MSVIETMQIHDFASNAPIAFQNTVISIDDADFTAGFEYSGRREYRDDELDFDEFKLAIFAFAATNVRVIPFTYDGNEDGQFSGNEVDAWS